MSMDFVFQTSEILKPTSLSSTRRPPNETNGEPFRYEVSSDNPVRGSRWPAINRSNRPTPSDEKVRRTQVCSSFPGVCCLSEFLAYLHYYLWTRWVYDVLIFFFPCDSSVQLASSSSRQNITKF